MSLSPRPTSNRQRRRPRLVSLPRLVSAALTAGAVMVGLLSGAAPAQAAYSIAFSPSGGTVGTPIALTSSVSSGAVGVGVGKVTYVAGGTAVATASVDATGAVAAASWTPAAAGTTAIYVTYASDDGTQTAISATTSVTIAKATTTTTLTMPPSAKVGAVASITATVTAGTYVPTGSVSFVLPSGTVLTSAALDSSGKATVSIQMPAQAASYQLTARYGGDGNALTSASAAGITYVTTTGSKVALTASTSSPVVGTAVTLTAAITPPTATGTVTFQAGSTVLGLAAISGGTATFAWTPIAAGATTLTAVYRQPDSAQVAGSDTLNVTVSATRPADRLTIGPDGQAAWAPGAGFPLRNAASVTVTATSQSGAAVTLAITGACTLSGSTIRAAAGSGSCTLVASSPGAGSVGPGSQTNTVTLIRGIPTAALNPPATGSSLARGQYYRLAAGGTLTSAGYPVKWRVTLGAKRCKVVKQADGSYLLRAKKVGRCNVRAYSPAVAGQWLKYKKLYRYTVRY